MNFAWGKAVRRVCVCEGETGVDRRGGPKAEAEEPRP